MNELQKAIITTYLNAEHEGAKKGGNPHRLAELFMLPDKDRLRLLAAFLTQQASQIESQVQNELGAMRSLLEALTAGKAPTPLPRPDRRRALRQVEKGKASA